VGSRFCLAVVFQPAALLAAGGWSAPRPATGVGKKGSGPEAETQAQKKGKGADGGVKSTSTVAPAPAAGATGGFPARTLTCVQCAADFVWSAEEQQRHAEKQYKNIPKKCLECRQKNYATIKTGCLKCGDTDHKQVDCPRGLVCFRCKEAGHTRKDCPKA
jgi:glutamate dehydrogenase/leucine dehydrogenase